MELENKRNYAFAYWALAIKIFQFTPFRYKFFPYDVQQLAKVKTPGQMLQLLMYQFHELQKLAWQKSIVKYVTFWGTFQNTDAHPAWDCTYLECQMEWKFNMWTYMD